MNLDNVTVELRPRSAWEAADLGVRLVRRDAAAIYKAWFATSLPLLATALAVIYLTPFAGYALLLYWWLEPVLDGPILDIVARRLFGGDANPAATVRATGTLARRNWLFLVTPWRLHFARSTAMPLTQLEGLSGDRRRKRAAVLNQSVLNHGIGVTVAYHHLVAVVYFGIVLGALMFVPTPYQGFDLFDTVVWIVSGEDRHTTALSLLLFYTAQTLLEPWFVGAGFGLYINCRTRLEAWDIEVAFRRMLARRQAALPALATVAFAITALAVTVTPARAQEAVDDPGFPGFWDEADYRNELDTVLADEAFQTTETGERWVPKNPREEAESDADLSGLRDFAEWLGQLGAFLAEFGLWILVGAIVLWLILKRELWLHYLFSGRQARARRPRVMLATGEVTAESLPADIPAAVQALWTEGRHREALSLLYRGSVFVLVDRYGVRLPASATEGACVAAVDRQADAAQSRFFRQVVDAWSRLAYGAEAPRPEQVTELVRGWRAQYGDGT